MLCAFERRTESAGARSLACTVVGRPDVPARLQLAGGDNQRGTIGGPLPAPLQARAIDRYGNPAPGARVAFFPMDSGIVVADPNQVTDAVGMATSGRVTLARRTGNQRIAVRLVGSSFQPWFTAFVPAGPPASIVWIAPSPFRRALDVGMNRRSPPAGFRVVDAYGTGVVNLPVTVTLEPAEMGVVSTVDRPQGSAVSSFTTSGSAGVSFVVDAFGINGLARVVVTASGGFREEVPVFIFLTAGIVSNR